MWIVGDAFACKLPLTMLDLLQLAEKAEEIQNINQNMIVVVKLAQQGAERQDVDHVRTYG